MTPKVINAHIGDVKTGKNNDTLQALLGSCIGVGMLWHKKGLYGLAHCLLPNAPQKTFDIDGRYVDQAISSLLALMHVHKDDYFEIEVIVAGGGNMTLPEDTPPESLVGTLNANSAYKMLKELKLKIVFSDTGGMVGRKIFIDCSSGKYEIRNIPRKIKK